jgi:hypothetical protein
MKYARGKYNKFDVNEQWIRISEGCPNNCEFCRETKECGTRPVYFDIPEIVRNQVKIMDMNLIYKPLAYEIINALGQLRVNNKVIYYELICGIDYRFMTKEMAAALKQSRFKNIRFAWDNGIEDQYKIRQTVNWLKSAGYDPKTLSCFVLCNWKVPYHACLFKLDLLKIWNVKINDCWFDNQVSPNIKPSYWTESEIKDFRRRCRKHNHMVRFGFDPEMKR